MRSRVRREARYHEPRSGRVSVRPAIATVVLCATLALAGAGCRTAAVGSAATAQYFPMPGATGQTPLPFSSAVRVGQMLYLAGQIGTDSAGTLVPGGIEAETRQTMENIRAALAQGGATMDQVVKCTVMLADINEWAAMNRVYATYFKPGRMPARSAFGTTGLVRGARVELECWAAVGTER